MNYHYWYCRFIVSVITSVITIIMFYVISVILMKYRFNNIQIIHLIFIVFGVNLIPNIPNNNELCSLDVINYLFLHYYYFSWLPTCVSVLYVQSNHCIIKWGESNCCGVCVCTAGYNDIDSNTASIQFSFNFIWNIAISIVNGRYNYYMYYRYCCDSVIVIDLEMYLEFITVIAIMYN